MIHLLPYMEERIRSEKTPEEIAVILKSVTESGRFFLTDAEFRGQIHSFDFRIIPHVHYRNSFLPTLAGNMTERNGGTDIVVTLRMHILTRIFLTFWFGMACFGFLWGIFAAFTGALEKAVLIFASLGFMAVSQILMRCGFYGPAGKALKRLKELLC